MLQIDMLPSFYRPRPPLLRHRRRPWVTSSGNPVSRGISLRGFLALAGERFITGCKAGR